VIVFVNHLFQINIVKFLTLHSV